jgi:hypothetical protein
MVNKKIVLTEIILIIASVFIFRGLWEILDQIPSTKDPFFLLLSLILGIIISISGIEYILKNSKK